MIYDIYYLKGRSCPIEKWFFLFFFYYQGADSVIFARGLTVLRLSVCVIVTLRYCVQMAKCILKIVIVEVLSQPYRPIIL